MKTMDRKKTCEQLVLSIKVLGKYSQGHTLEMNWWCSVQSLWLVSIT